MANYPKELLDLLQEYLTDGYIDDDERQVLLSKAQMLGVNPMEFNLYIKSQEQKIEFAKQEALNKEKGRLCPYCQQPLPMLADTCPHCNQAVTVEASKEVEELINALETALVDFKAIAEKKKAGFSFNNPAQQMQQMQDMKNVLSGKGIKADNTNVDYATKKAEVERYIRKAKMYYSNNKTVNFLVSEVEKAVEDAEKSVAAAKKKKRNIILAIVGGFVLFYAVLFICLGLDTTPEEDVDELLQDAIALVNEGKISEADQMLASHNIPEGFSGKGYGEEEYPDDIVKKYDAAFLAVVNAYLNNNNYDAAEAIAGAYKSKINNIYSWRRSSVYAKLKSYCDKNGIDFSVLDSERGSSSSSGRRLNSESSSSSYDDKEDEYSYDDEEDESSNDDEEDSYNPYEEIENAAQEIANEVYESYGSYSGW